MTKIMVIAKCKDPAKWEAGFRTHGDLFRAAYGVSNPISYGMGEDDYVGPCFETSDLGKTTTAISSAETAKAMEYDGLFLDTAKVFVLDKELGV
jgi:hypothetical protein